MLAHHERIDGQGYPDGLAGDDIPIAARILAIAEVYDVLTSEGSYRQPLSAAEAEDELRRVAGAQLDGRLVWLFVTQVLPGRLLEHEGKIADLEVELQVQRRVRGALDGPFVLGPPAASGSVDQAAAGRPDRQAPHQQAEGEQDAEVGDVDPALEAEAGVADELDAVVERVEPAATCAHSGSPLIGKNVPATRNIGVISVLVT